MELGFKRNSRDSSYVEIGWNLWGLLPHLLPQRSAYRLARTACNRDARKFSKGSLVGANDVPLLGACRRSDDEVVGATWRSRPPNVRQQIGMCLGHVEVVGLNRDGVENRCHKALPLLLPAPFGQLDTDPQLRHGDRRDRYVIAVVDHLL